MLNRNGGNQNKPTRSHSGAPKTHKWSCWVLPFTICHSYSEHTDSNGDREKQRASAHKAFTVSHRTQCDPATAVYNLTSELFFFAVTLTWVPVHYRNRPNKIGQGLPAKTAIMCRPSTLSCSLPAPGACTAAALLHGSVEQLPEPTDGLQSTSQGIMPLINQPSMFRAMNYLSHLHFVGEGWRRGLACGEDHDDEDSDEEEGEDRPHHSSGHGDGVRPLRLRLLCDKVQTLWVPQTREHRHEWVKGTEPKACCHRGESPNVQILWGAHSKLLKRWHIC